MFPALPRILACSLAILGNDWYRIAPPNKTKGLSRNGCQTDGGDCPAINSTDESLADSARGRYRARLHRLSVCMEHVQSADSERFSKQSLVVQYAVHHVHNSCRSAR